ncbi:zinc-dependent metalloproteinase lipoprotein [Dysgonomonas sp. ZJ279]|uniref:zinc-dependent metalloproteinase lipoprotein n=1 Tax=Dysgonomonas sp. ZJ279 TaxID=2709796 RepID=UPI0021023FC7|nr:zinc-dependent metalloproteinase lipoprotein [Dysgonomonas sp. ZJ279]
MMKIKLILLLSILFLSISCKDSDEEKDQPQIVVTDNYHYEIPIIFHVLYQNQNDPYQYVDKGRLSQIVAACNKLYQSKLNANGTDINIEFVMATVDPKGNTLSEPGVERILWQTPVMDCEKFMETESATNAKLLWNVDQYINIMLYTFTDENALGISHLPFTLTSNSLEGLNQTDRILNHSNLNFPYCVSINNSYLYDQSDDRIYRPTDITVTLAHELGHYLGLLHAFSEGDDENTNLCQDTDYCADTPTYNRSEYNIWRKGLSENEYIYNNLITRINCSGTKFISYNIMDYEVSKSNQFTQNQKERIRHVLAYSPLIPGPKKDRTKAYSQDGPMDLPIRTMK